MMDRQTWRGFLRTHAKFNSGVSALLSLGGEWPKDTREFILARHRQGRIDDGMKDSMLMTLKVVRKWYDTDASLVDVRDGSDWVDLGNGGRMRINHTPEEYVHADRESTADSY